MSGQICLYCNTICIKTRCLQKRTCLYIHRGSFREEALGGGWKETKGNRRGRGKAAGTGPGLPHQAAGPGGSAGPLARPQGRPHARAGPGPAASRPLPGAAAGRGAGRTGKRPPLRPGPLCPSALAQRSRSPGIKQQAAAAAAARSRSGLMETLRRPEGGRPVPGVSGGREAAEGKHERRQRLLPAGLPRLA